MSTGRLDSNGLKLTIENGMRKISSSKKLIGCAIRTSDNPYLCEFKGTINELVLVTKSISTNTDWLVWHQRLCQLSGSYIRVK